MAASPDTPAVPDRHPSGGPVSGRFPTTRWSIVAEAGAPPSPESRCALSTLCDAYWYPVYAYLRRQGHEADDAQDLTQGFFATLLEKGYVKTADQQRGRFRTFLLTAVKRFAAKEHDKATAQKRGGGETPISLDLASAEDRYALEPADDRTPERIYERRWALALLDQVLGDVRRRYAQTDKARLFDHLKGCLTGEAGRPYGEIASDLEMTEGAVKVAVHRLRERYRRALRSEIAQTVDDPREVDDELNVLLSALRDGP